MTNENPMFNNYVKYGTELNYFFNKKWNIFFNSQQHFAEIKGKK